MPTTFNTTDPKPGYVYETATDTWFPLLGIAPGSSVVRWRKTAVGAETSVSGLDDLSATLSYNAGTEQVYLNGVLLVRTEDYLATTGTSITGLTALAASDVIEVISFNATNVQITDALLETDINAKGDLIVGAAVDTAAILTSGTNGQVLSVNTATATGLEWIANDQGDITGVTAGTGISGGGTSGTVTVTNSMATAIDAKGDLVAGTGADAFARLGVGANGTVLTAASGQATGLEWATPSSGGMTLLSTTSLSGASTTVSSIDQTYTHLYLVAFGLTNATGDGNFRLQPNSSASSCSHTYIQGTSVSATAADTWKWSGDQNNMTRTNSGNTFTAIIENYSNTNVQKNMSSQGIFSAAAGLKQVNVFGTFNDTSAITAIQVRNDSGNLSTGTLLIYGVK